MERGGGYAVLLEDLLEQQLHVRLAHVLQVQLVFLDGGLPAAVAEVVTGSRLPSVDAALVLPLVVLPPQGERVFHPDQQLLVKEAGFLVCLDAGVDLAAGHPDVTGGSGLEAVPDCHKASVEEVSEGAVAHIVVFYRFAVAVAYCHVVGRVCHQKVR